MQDFDSSGLFRNSGSEHETYPRSDQLHTNKKVLIITSGDISDIDGFLALAEYAKTGADALFVIDQHIHDYRQEGSYIRTCLCVALEYEAALKDSASQQQLLVA
jgi:hypothetical protein